MEGPMAHYKRKRPRTLTAGYYSANGRENRLDGKSGGKAVPERKRRNWTCAYPRWHDKLYHTRPNRKRNRMLERAVLKGSDSDGIVWPHHHKPHNYYW